MISGQVCVAGRLHPTIQSKHTHLVGHWTKWTAPAVISKTTGSCLFAVCLVALFFPAGGHTKPLAKRPVSHFEPVITPKMKFGLTSPTNECFKINSSMPMEELNGFFEQYPSGKLVQIKSSKTQNTLCVSPMSEEVFWSEDPKNNAKYFRTSKHPTKPGNLIENVFSCRHLCIDSTGKLYTYSSVNVNDNDECRFNMTFRKTSGTIADHNGLASLSYSNATHTLLLDSRNKDVCGRRKVRARYVQVGQEDENFKMIIFPYNITVVLEEATQNNTISTTATPKARRKSCRRKRRRRKCRQSVRKGNPDWSVNKVKAKCRKKEFIRKCRQKRRRKTKTRRHKRRQERKICSQKYKARRKRRRNND